MFALESHGFILRMENREIPIPEHNDSRINSHSWENEPQRVRKPYEAQYFRKAFASIPSIEDEGKTINDSPIEYLPVAAQSHGTHK
mmetsp:Transcript_9194/g.14144  ORF Transcript_9194/g.14144 Transcript_9194/m.14144 type:complete len:86 (+) Transcript_9194:1428-1685(+)